MISLTRSRAKHLSTNLVAIVIQHQSRTMLTIIDVVYEVFNVLFVFMYRNITVHNLEIDDMNNSYVLLVDNWHQMKMGQCRLLHRRTKMKPAIHMH